MTQAHKVKSGYCFVLLVSCVMLMQPAFAQLKVYPLPGPAGSVKKTKTKSSVARTQELLPRSLPFWDDFSWTNTAGLKDSADYPVDSLWVNNYTVLINSGLAVNSPSLNVATFNGLNDRNLPYSDQILSNGFRDTLMSQPIRLNEVATGERNSVYLSFFYQWNGNGEPPDPDDYLRVDFKNDAGTWESIATIKTKPSFTFDQFYDTLLKVDGDRFFHESFQFRFMNFGRLSGPFDTWNLDYVYLNKNRTDTDRYLPDQSITSTMTNLFKDYRAVPFSHFLANKNAAQDPVSQPSFGVFNVKNDTSTLSYSTRTTFVNYKDSIPSSPYIVDAGPSPIDGLTGIIFPRQRKTVTLAPTHLPNANDPDQFHEDSDYVSVSMLVQLNTGDTFKPNTSNEYADDYDPLKYKPLDFRSNDTLRADYWLTNYYAYDDGTGEYAVGLTAFGNRAAYLFEMLTEEPDTIVGFDIYFPDYGVTSNLTVEFTVYNDINGLPGVPIYTLPNFTIVKQGLNKFVRVPFVEAFLVQDRFYIGWKAPVGGTFKVGLDTNNDAGSKLFVNTNGSWIQNTDIVGSVMIRPVFGSGDVVTGIPEEEIQSQIFPNPNNGNFYIPSSFKILLISTVTGQSIPFTTQEQGENQKINLASSSPGMYILRLQKDGRYFSSKIVVR